MALELCDGHRRLALPPRVDERQGNDTGNQSPEMVRHRDAIQRISNVNMAHGLAYETTQSMVGVVP